MSEEEFLNRLLNKIAKNFGYDEASTLELMFIKKEKEIDKLNNIINELEKWIKENNLGKYRTENVVNTDELLDKLKELKENK